MANIASIDLNLLRVFDAVYRLRNISRAAAELGLSQPATSQALTRLRLALRDPLFQRHAAGVKPTPRAEQLARSVQGGLALLEAGLDDAARFDPATSTAELRLHLTDVGEARFLPTLMQALRVRAPYMQVQAAPWPLDTIATALDSGELHFAIGFLPGVDGTAKVQLLSDRYVLLLRADHPFAQRSSRRPPSPERLAELDFVAVRSHSDTLRILQWLKLEHRVRLTTSSFLALETIVATTDLAVLMPHGIAQDFEPTDRFALVETGLPAREFTVSLHWSRRHERAPMQRWMLVLMRELFEVAPSRKQRRGGGALQAL